MNKIIVTGRMTKDPEVRQTPSVKYVAGFTLAVDRPFLNQQGQREADFIPVVVWGKAATLVGNRTRKGSRLMVEGRLQIRNFDAKDGTKHWVTEIVASNIEFLDPKSVGDKIAEEKGVLNRVTEIVTPNKAAAETAEAATEAKPEIPNEEFPF